MAWVRVYLQWSQIRAIPNDVAVVDMEVWAPYHTCSGIDSMLLQYEIPDYCSWISLLDAMKYFHNGNPNTNLIQILNGPSCSVGNCSVFKSWLEYWNQFSQSFGPDFRQSEKSCDFNHSKFKLDIQNSNTSSFRVFGLHMTKISNLSLLLFGSCFNE